MKVIHLNGFTPVENEAYRQQIWLNLCEAMATCLELAASSGLALRNGGNEVARGMFDKFLEVRDREAYPAEYEGVMRSLWADPTIQECVARGAEVNLGEK